MKQIIQQNTFNYGLIFLQCKLESLFNLFLNLRE